ncbi:MAG: hypothetical protein NTV81_00005, partial [Candidatus Komeilibacteria bacterium]|nr:hypothetical protein [Candidatus Komeilibacteria bacterium]
MLRFVNTWITLIAVLAIAGGLFGVTEQAIAVERAWNLSIQPDSYQIDGANGGRIQPTVGASYRMGPGQTVVGIYDQDWRCLDAQVVEWQRDGQEHDGAFRAQWPGQIFV